MATFSNRSYYDTEELRALTLKVIPYFKYHSRGHIVIETEEKYGGIGHGLYKPSTKTAIIWLPRPGILYPFRDLYKKRAGDKVIQCWQDLFVCILAHELRHLDQDFMRWEEGLKFPQYEVDAERYAFKVFDKYRETL